MARRITSKSAFFLKTDRNSKASGKFGTWGHLAQSRKGKNIVIVYHTKPMGNPNPKHRFTSTNQPPRP